MFTFIVSNCGFSVFTVRNTAKSLYSKSIDFFFSLPCHVCSINRSVERAKSNKCPDSESLSWLRQRITVTNDLDKFVKPEKKNVELREI